MAARNDMPVKKVIFDCQGNLKSEEFLRDEIHRFLGYGGAKGGAKSWSLRAKALKRRLDHPGSSGLLLRRTWQEIFDNHIKYIQTEWSPFGEWNKEHSTFNFHNGSIQSFGYARREEEVREKYYGIERDDIGIDEATQQAEGSINHLDSCVRATVKGIIPQLWLATNPGGKGHGWFKRLFITKVYEKEQDPKDYHFISAKVDDNKILQARDHNYIRQLEKLPPDLRRMLRDGDWDIFEGQAFPELRRDVHGFTHNLSDTWPVGVCYDWGYDHPYAIYLFKIDPSGRFWFFKEFYGWGGKADTGSKETTIAVATKLKKYLDLTGIKPIIHLAGPDFFAEQSGAGMFVAKSYREDFSSQGIILTKMPTPGGSRLQGKMAFHNRLAPMIAGGQPGIMFHLTECHHFWRTVPELVYDQDKNDGDIDTDGEDHPFDAIAHSCRWRAWGKPVEETPKPKLTAKERDAIRTKQIADEAFVEG